MPLKATLLFFLPHLPSTPRPRPEQTERYGKTGGSLLTSLELPRTGMPDTPVPLTELA